MQLAQSTSLPIDPNLLALLFPGAAPSAGTLPGGLQSGAPVGAGFESLLPEVAAPVVPGAPAPVDFSGGRPLAFAVATAANRGSPSAPAIESGSAPVFPGDPLLAPMRAFARANGEAVAAVPKEQPLAAPEARVEQSRDLRNAEEAVALLFASAPVAPAEDAAIDLGMDAVVTETAEDAASISPDVTRPVESRRHDAGFTVTSRPAATKEWRGVAPELDGAAVEAEDFGQATATEFARPQFTPTGLPVSDSRPASADTHLQRGLGGDEQSRARVSPDAAQQLRVSVEAVDTTVPVAAKSTATVPNQPSAVASSGVAGTVAAASGNRRENSAAFRERRTDLGKQGDFDGERSFVSKDPEHLTERPSPGGIEFAKPVPTMPASHSPASPPVRSADVPALAVQSSGSFVERVESHNVLALALDGVSSAHEAVEVVLRTADRLSSLVHKSVRLEFAVAGERLDVRVEVHANEVRTTFHTESPELRSALAAEWQSVSASAGQGDRSLRILPAQFGESATGNSFSGDASSRHREPHYEPPAETAQGFVAGNRRRASRSLGTAAVAPAADTSFAAPGTALRLHTLA